MNDNKIKFGICQWCLPIDGPYACKIAADLGLEGIELNFSNNVKDEPLTRKYVQRAYLDAGKEWGITYSAIGVNTLVKYGMSKIKNMDIVKGILESSIDVATQMDIKIMQLPSFGEINRGRFSV